MDNKLDIAANIAEELEIKKWQVEAVIKLIDEGNTIPFIARYRKEAHGSLDDEQLRNLNERLTYLRNLEEKKAQEAEADKESKVIEAIVNDSEMDIPEKMIEAQCQQMVEEFAQNIAMQGISFDQYMQFTGTTVDQLTEQVKPQAEARVQSSLVLEAIVKAEKIEASDEEFDEEIKRMAERYQMEADKVNELLSDDDKKNIRADICARKAAKLVVEKAK